MNKRHIAENQSPVCVSECVHVRVCVYMCLFSLYDLFPLPTESNCTYFKFFTSGENAVIFKKTTQKSEALHSPLSFIQMHTVQSLSVKMFTGVLRGPRMFQLIYFCCHPFSKVNHKLSD